MINDTDRRGAGRAFAGPIHARTQRFPSVASNRLLLDAVRRQAPLQEWCVVDGYPPLVHNPWATLYVQRAAQDREKQLIELTLQP